MDIFGFFAWLLSLIIQFLSIPIPYLNTSMWAIVIGSLIVSLVFYAGHRLFGKQEKMDTLLTDLTLDQQLLLIIASAAVAVLIFYMFKRPKGGI